MTNEIELKLSISPADAARFLTHPLLQSSSIKQRLRLISVYYDTPALALMHQRAALRVRMAGTRWIQTIKIGGQAINGMHSRPEWEVELADQQPQPDLFTEPLVTQLLSAELTQQLTPVFQTDFWRDTWLIDFHGAKIEVALDQGKIISLAQDAPICEVELELKQGDAQQLTELAQLLGQDITLTPDSISKAQRGYTLYQNQISTSS
ncbi:MAG: CYTH domain-containing protein [Sulfuriferula sp.]